jgi:hypothetical protein
VGSHLSHRIGVPPRDRSCDRNEQHRAALGHHPANVAFPCRVVRSEICMHLLIAALRPLQTASTAIIVNEPSADAVHTAQSQTIPGVGTHSGTPFHTVATGPHAPMTMDRSATGPSVGRLSGRNNAQQRDATPTDERVFSLVGAVHGAVIRKPAWSPGRCRPSSLTTPAEAWLTSGDAEPDGTGGQPRSGRIQAVRRRAPVRTPENYRDVVSQDSALSRRHCQVSSPDVLYYRC